MRNEHNFCLSARQGKRRFPSFGYINGVNDLTRPSRQDHSSSLPERQGDEYEREKFI